jgi:hypothetical protein
VYLYSIGYGTCEESDYRQYSHGKKFSREDLRDIVRDCVIETIEHYASKFNEEGYHDDFFYVSSEGPTLEHILDSEFYQQRLESRGFVPLKFESSLGVFGWASAMDPDDWEGHTSESDRELRQQIANACRDKGIFVEKTEECHRLNFMNNIWTAEELMALKLKNEYPFGKKKQE